MSATERRSGFTLSLADARTVVEWAAFLASEGLSEDTDDELAERIEDYIVRVDAAASPHP